MKDPTLERVWRSRDVIAKKCGYDSRKLVKFLQEQQRTRKGERVEVAPKGESAQSAQ